MAKQIFSMDFYGKKIQVEVGEMAKQANGSCLVRYDNTVLTTCTSFLKPSANNGRIGLSIILAVNVPCSLGRPSRFKKPPGILPTEYSFSSYVNVN